MKREIKLLKHAIKKGEQDPFLYSTEETLKLKKQNYVNLNIGKSVLESHKTMDLDSI